MLRSWGLWVVLLLSLYQSLNMASRSTRNKIRWQAEQAYIDLSTAQVHLVQLVALAGNHSDVINEFLPVIVASLETVITAVDNIKEKL